MNLGIHRCPPPTPEEQSNLVSVRVLWVQMNPGPNSPTRASRPKILPVPTSWFLLATKLLKFARLRPSGNMVSAAVAPLDFMVLLVRLCVVNASLD